MASIYIPTVFNIELAFETAAFRKRLLAYIIDFALMIAYIYVAKSALYNLWDLVLGTNMGLDILIVSLPMLLYSLICEVVLNGQTVGKKLMKIRVVSLEGGQPTFSQYLIRWITKFYEWPFLFGYIAYSAGYIFLYIIMTGFLGIAVALAIVVTPRNQRLGDIAAGTVVVDTETSMNITDTVFLDINGQHYIPRYPEVMRLSDNDINTIKSVLKKGTGKSNRILLARVTAKIEEVLDVLAKEEHSYFLEQLLRDYNYLATKE